MSHLLIKVDALHANGINCGMSAFTPKSGREASPLREKVRFVPIADIAALRA